MYFYLYLMYTINILYKNCYMRGIYEYTYMSHHYYCYRYIPDEAVLTTAHFDWYGHSYDVYCLWR